MEGRRNVENVMITEKIKKIASVVMTVAIICTTPTVAFAANKTIHIPRLGAGYKKNL